MERPVGWWSGRETVTIRFNSRRGTLPASLINRFYRSQLVQVADQLHKLPPIKHSPPEELV